MGDSTEVVGASSRPPRRTFANSGHGDTEMNCTSSHRTGSTSRGGVMVFDCRPQVLPGAIDVSGTELAEIRSMTRARVATAAPSEREQSFGGGGGQGGTCWVRSARSWA